MPDRDKSILPVPSITPSEADARKILKMALSLIDGARLFLEVAHAQMPDPPDAEDMGEGRIPESLAFSLRGSVEVVLEDNLRPAIKTLRKALKETPEKLVRAWEKRRKGRQ